MEKHKVLMIFGAAFQFRYVWDNDLIFFIKKYMLAENNN